MTAILGVSAFCRDSAAALVVDGEVVAAAQEERFSREKQDERFPAQAVEYCLSHAKLSPETLDHVVFHAKPLLEFERLLETHIACAPGGFRAFVRAVPPWLTQRLHVARELDRGLAKRFRNRYLFTEHHASHAASAFFPSPFEEAALLAIDGVGEWATTSFGTGRGNRIELSHEMRFPHSLGLLYAAFASFCGFPEGDEHELMDLAAYGEPRHRRTILEHLIDLKDDGSFRVDIDCLEACRGPTATRRLERLFGGPPRASGAPITEREMDLAASIQDVTEEILLRTARHLHARTGLANLCLAGGVALNCAAVGRVGREGPFERVWVPSAAGDAGGALGAALFVWHQLLGEPRAPSPRRDSLLGGACDPSEIGALLAEVGAVHERVDDPGALCDRAADEIAAGRVVAWFQRRMEFGPLALGARSILGDARDPRMRATIERQLDFRESHRPVGGAVLAEHAAEYFEVRNGASPALDVARVSGSKRTPLAPEAARARGLEKLHHARSVVPAVTHVDGCARVQTVDGASDELFRRLLLAVRERTGCPVVANASFHLGWDPIVRSPRDAYRTFMASELDVLCMGPYVLRKRDQPAAVRGVRTEEDEVLAELLASPCCRAALAREESGYRCAACGHVFPIDVAAAGDPAAAGDRPAVGGGIPQLFWPHESIADRRDVTERVKEFYEETPFPNYDDHDSARSLVEKSRRGLYARRLDETIPYNSTVLEVGCGTGQLTNFLGLGCRRVIGTDMCLNSLRLGEAFRREHGLGRVRFAQMNLFRPCFRPGSFDVVLCNGVLHHTADPAGGFRILAELVKPGGHFVLGLYNTYGRLMTDLRRQLFRVTGGRGRWIDPILRRSGLGGDKRRAWFADQYRHPHESKHTSGEVLRWFDGAGLEFVRGIPALRPDDDGLDGASLFEPLPRGSVLERFLAQAMQVFATGQKEGGFFVMIARRPERAAAEGGAADGDRRVRP